MNPSRTAATPREVHDVRHDKTANTEAGNGPPKPVRAFDYASVIEGLRDEKSFEDHGRGVRILAHDPPCGWRSRPSPPGAARGRGGWRAPPPCRCWKAR